MNPDRDKLHFYTGDPIDKIVQGLTRETISNNGATSSWQIAKIVTKNITNPYGKRCFVRGKWSIDGGATWNTFYSRLRYGFTLILTGSFSGTQDAFGLKAAVSIGVSDSQIKFVTANGDHGNVTIDTDGVNPDSYTPIAHTFLIDYVLFEVL